MDIDDLGYSKSEPTRSVHASEKESTAGPEKAAATSASGEIMAEISSEYSKPEIGVETVCMFLVSGGEKRERDYFSYLRAQPSRRLRVIFVSKKGQGLTPTQMIKEVEESIEEEYFCDYNGQLAYIAPEDSIYLISDLDQYRAELQTLLRRQQQEKYRWIISNPAFEVWLYYHYYDTPDIIKEAAAIGPDKRSQWLKDRLHQLRDGGVNPVKAIMLIETAIKNSKANYSVTEDLIPTLFSTQMYIVGEHLLSVLKDDFYKIIRDRSGQAGDFMSKL